MAAKRGQMMSLPFFYLVHFYLFHSKSMFGSEEKMSFLYEADAIVSGTSFD